MTELFLIVLSFVFYDLNFTVMQLLGVLKFSNTYFAHILFTIHPNWFPMFSQSLLFLFKNGTWTKMFIWILLHNMQSVKQLYCEVYKHGCICCRGRAIRLYIRDWAQDEVVLLENVLCLCVDNRQEPYDILVFLCT